MARIRSIHYDALKSEKLASVGAEAERCYWRLATHCDDDGRAEDNPRLFAAYLFPLHDEADGAAVNDWLDELETAGLIVRYESDGDRFLAVTRWADYQKPQKKRDSVLPAPPVSHTPPVVVPDEDATALVLVSPGEGEEIGVGEGEELAPTTRRDPYFDGLVNAWQIEARELTDPERDRVGVAASRLRKIQADPGEIPARRQMYALLFPDAAQTMMALVNRWAECRPDPARLPVKPGRNTSTVARAIARAE